MPEGPSIVILRELADKFKGQTVLRAEGNTRQIDLSLLEFEVVTDIKSWGKHFLICFAGFTVRIHFLLYGSSLIDMEKSTPVRLALHFANGTIRFFACSVRLITDPLDEVYDWSADVLSPAWNPRLAVEKLLDRPEMTAGDSLLDQDIFAGCGNIIRNEVLFRIRVHPESLIGKLPPGKLRALVREAVDYSKDFLAWKKAFVLRKHFCVYRKSVCPRDGVLLMNRKLGKYARRSYYCPFCQRIYI